jgi:hypothetical protein
MDQRDRWPGRESRILTGNRVPCTVIEAMAGECFPLKPATFLCHLPRKMPDLAGQLRLRGQPNLPTENPFEK